MSEYERLSRKFGFRDMMRTSEPTPSGPVSLYIVVDAARKRLNDNGPLTRQEAVDFAVAFERNNPGVECSLVEVVEGPIVDEWGMGNDDDRKHYCYR